MAECSVKRGPSAEQWITHRDEITALYLRDSLPMIREHMDKQYGFRASKRMFDARFKSWGIKKNLRKEDKIELAASMTRGGSVTEKDRRKVIRYTKAQQRPSRSKSVSTSSEEGEGQSLSEQSSPYSPEQHTPSSTGLSIVNRSPTIEASTPPQSIQTLVRQSYGTHSPVRVETQLPNHAMGRLSLEITFTGPSQTSSHDTGFQVAMPMASQLSLSAIDYNTQRLLSTMAHFITGRVQLATPFSSNQSVLDDGEHSLNKSFWNKVENGIYLYKIRDSSGLAEPALAEAVKLLQVMFSGGQVSLDFLRKVLYTLSPTNTVMCSGWRNALLELIRQYASEGLGPKHPVPVICEILLADKESSELSRQALNWMHERLCTDLKRSHAAASKVMDSIITLARRTGEHQLRQISSPSEAQRSLALKPAMDLAESGHELAIEDHGLSSDQSRQAAYTLAELCTVTSDHDRAQDLRLSIIQQDRSPQSCRSTGMVSFSFHQDAICAYTMESIAEARERDYDLQGCKIWLEQAESIASRIWDQSNTSRAHISKKLQGVYLRLGENLLSTW